MKSHSRRLCKVFVFCFLFFLAFQSEIVAQDLDDVTISGKIVDQTGAAVVGATVRAILVRDNQERTATSDATGRYRLIELKPGTYVVNIAATGFANLEQKELNTVSGQNLQLNYVLTPATVSANTVIIDEESAATIDTTRTIVGGTITAREIEELPNLNRNPFDLILTFGGVTEEPFSTRDLAADKGTRGQRAPDGTPAEAGVFALSGGAAYSNNVTIDGHDNNDDREASYRFQPSLETVAEVQVVTNQFSAEYGRASGGRVNLRTRAGGQDFRGRLFYFFRDESLDANTNRNKARGIARPASQDNNPGFTVGGPVPFGYFKSKTFFFAGYEYENVDENTVIETFVPVNQNPRFALPAPTSPTQIVNDEGALIAPFSETVQTPFINHILTARVDHNFTASHNLAVAYQRGMRRDFRQFSGGSRLAEALVGSSRNSDAVSFTENYIFSPTVVNQLRVQFSVLKPSVATDSSLTSSPVVVVNLPAVVDRGGTLTAGSSTSNASDRRELRTQLQNTLTAIWGSQTLRFGADVQRINSNFIDLEDATGTFRFDSANDFLQNRLLSYTQIFGSRSTQRNTYAGVFVQDDWRIKNNLTASFGLRYERETIIDDKNNLSPRLAVAYNPFKDDQGVIRFGAGIFYNRALLRTIDDFSLGKSQIEFKTSDVPAGANRSAVLDILSREFPQALTADNPLVRQYGRTNTDFSRRLDASLQVPESYQTNLGFERELVKGFVIEANFTVNKTVRLWRDVSVNAPRAPAGFRDLAEYLLSKPFDNAVVNGRRPIYNVSGARNVIRFANSYSRPPVGSPLRCPGNNSTPANAEQGGCLVINGVPTTVINLNSQMVTNASPPITVALAALQNLRPDPTRAQLEQLSSIGSSFYRGLTFELRQRLVKLGQGLGVTLRAVYTLSTLKDDGSVNTSSAQIQGDFDSDFARSLLDRRHRFVLSGTFDTPLWTGKIRFSPIVRWSSGAPFNLSAGGIDRNLDDVNNDRPDFSGKLTDLRSRTAREPFPNGVFEALTRPVIGSSGGNLPRNAGSGPGQFLFDLNLSRPVKFSKHIVLRPNVEINNVFNSTVFSFGAGFINQTDPQTTFLVPQRTLRPRLIRIGVRFDW